MRVLLDEDPDETAWIKKSGLRHVSYRQRVGGIKGLSLACRAIIASMSGIIEELSVSD